MTLSVEPVLFKRPLTLDPQLDAVTDHVLALPSARSTRWSSRALSKAMRVVRQCPIKVMMALRHGRTLNAPGRHR
jgi:hypothetical protein